MAKQAFLLFSAALFCATGAVAQKHLDPEAPKYDFEVRYQNNIKAVLHKAYADDVILRMIGEPSFSSEYVVGLKKTETGRSIFGLRTKTQIWAFQSREQMKQTAAGCDVAKHPDCKYLKHYIADMPDDIHNIGVKGCELSISDALAASIEDAWRLSLLKAGNGGDERVGIDGENFYFAMNEGGHHLGGKVWSPDAGSDPGKLVYLAIDMNKLCEGKGAVTFSTIKREASELADKLRAKR